MLMMPEGAKLTDEVNPQTFICNDRYKLVIMYQTDTGNLSKPIAKIVNERVLSLLAKNPKYFVDAK